MKMTKTQKRNALKSIQSKAAKLYLVGAMNLKDTSAIEAIITLKL